MLDYKPLTKQEKGAIIARHHYLVDKMNEVLNNELKYEDEEILKRLDDPDEVAIYRINQEYNRRSQLREQIREQLEAKYGPSTIPNNPVMRFLNYSFRVGGSQKDREYNEKIYQEAISNPAKFAYRKYSKLLEVQAKDLYDLKGDRVAQAEYYLAHEEMCEQAYCIQGVVSAEATHASKGIKDALASMKKPFESMKAYSNIVKQGGMDYFACPSLNREQAMRSFASTELFRNNPNPELTEVVNGKLGMNEITGTPDQFIDELKEEGIDINQPDLFLKYKAIKNNSEREEVSFDDKFVKHDPRVIIMPRSDEEMFQIKAFNKVFQEKYVDKFQSRIALKLNQLIFDANQIEDEHKGSWFERNIWHSTSKEWSEFIEAFKNYNDPNHPNYSRKDILRVKGQAYLAHKKDQGYEILTDMKGTSLKRGTLVQATLDTINDLDKQEDSIREDINIEINTGLRGKVGLIIEGSEVDIFDNNIENNHHENNMDLDHDLVNSVDEDIKL